MAYTWIYGGIVVALVGFGVYLTKQRSNKAEEMPHPKAFNPAIIHDRGNRHEKYKTWYLAAKLNVQANKEMIKIGWYPADYCIIMKNFEKKIPEEANMEFVTVVERKYLKLTKPEIPDISVAEYDLLCPETEEKEKQDLHNEIDRLTKEKESSDRKYLDLLYAKSNDEHDIMSIKKMQMLSNITANKQPTVTIENEAKK